MSAPFPPRTRLHFFLIFSFSFLGILSVASALTCTSTAAGNWDAPATWSGCGGATPGVNDTAVIGAHWVTINVSTTVTTLKVTPGSADNNLTLLSTATLTVSGDVVMTQPSSPVSHTSGLDFGDGTATIGGTLNFASTSGLAKISSVTIRSGILTVSSITFTGATPSNVLLIMNGGAGTLNLTGLITGTTCATLTAGSSSIFNYGGNGNQTVETSWGAGGYNHLHFKPSVSGTIKTVAAGTLSAADVVIGDGVNGVTVDASVNNPTIVAVGTVTIATGSTLTASTPTLSVNGGWNNSGTYTHNNSTVVVTGASVIPFTGSTTFYGLKALTVGATLQFAAGTTTYVTNMVEFRNISLKSPANGATSYFTYTGSSQTLVNLRVRDNNAAGGSTMTAADGTSTDLGNNTNWVFDVTPPSAVTNLSALNGSGTLSLTWTAPGDDGLLGNINPGTFRLFYSTVSSDLSVIVGTSAATATSARLDIATSSVIPGSTRLYSLSGLLANNTYYVRVFTADEVPNWSSVSNGATSYTAVAVPVAITDLVATAQRQILLTWTAPSPAPGAYEIRFSTTGSISTEPNWSTATVMGSGSATSSPPSSPVLGTTTMSVTGLRPGTTYWFAIKSSNTGGQSALDTSTPEPFAIAGIFGPPIEPAGATGPGGGTSAWGDFDNDGDLDIAVNGQESGTTYRFRIYPNNGNGTFGSAIQPAGTTGPADGTVAWGDFDNDGDLDIAVNGRESSSAYRFRVYPNNGNGTFGSAIEPAGVTGPSQDGNVAWGDFDNDGDLDLAVTGRESNGTFRFRIYPNNGNGTFGTAIEPAGVSGPDSGLAWGDFDNDGDLDLGVGGYDSVNWRFRIYPNNGNGTFAAPVEPNGATGPGGSLAWGDFDNDGDLDLAVCGYDGSNNRFQMYANNGNGTFGSAIEPAGAIGPGNGGVAWGDFDNDGNLDLAVNGSDGTASRFRVYPNNGNGTFGSAIEPAGTTGPGTGGVSWADFDNDGDIDLAVNGFDGVGYRFRIYPSYESVIGSNVAPSAPSSITSSFAYNVSRSTLTFKWDGGSYDTGRSSNSVYYNLWMGTNTLASSPPAGFDKTIIASRQGSPFLGNYLKPAFKTWPGDGAGKFGVTYSTTPGLGTNAFTTDSSYYFRVQTVDAGLLGSSWSSQNVARTDVAPSAVTNLSALIGVGPYLNLNWTAPGDDGVTGNLSPGTFRIFFSTVSGAMTGLTATTSTTSTLGKVDISTTGVIPGTTRFTTLTSLVGSVTTYYLRIFTGDEVPNWSALSNGATLQTLGYFDQVGIAITAPNGGLTDGNTAWGDFDNDGDLDILINGLDSSPASQLRVYENNGNGTFNSTPIEVAGAGNGPVNGGVAWGDFDNDGDLDIAANGFISGVGFVLRVYRNKGDKTFNAPIDVASVNEAVEYGDVAWGDSDNDGDLDLLVSGVNANGGRQLRVYKNNGAGGFAVTPTEVEARDAGLEDGSVQWGDFDHDGDLDILTSGVDANVQLRVYKNSGNGSFDPTQLEIDGINGGLYGGEAVWGDFDDDGDLDILANGLTTGTTEQLRVYRNNGNGTFDTNQIEVNGLDAGEAGSVAWGDVDNDGDLDVLASGSSNRSTGYRLVVHRNNGNGTIDPNGIDVNGATADLGGKARWGDFDNDGDLDILAAGFDGTQTEIRVYRGLIAQAVPNSVPSTPSGLLAAGSAAGVELRWSASADGAFDPNSLYYNVRVSTLPASSTSTVVASIYGSPLLGNTIRPKLSDAQLGRRLRLAGGATYYWSVQAIDSQLGAGAFSTESSTYVAVAAPNPISDLVAVSGNQITLTWTAPYPIATSYQIRRSTTGPIVTGADFSTGTVVGVPVPSASGADTVTLTGLIPDTTYWFAIKAANAVGTSALDTSAPEPFAVAGFFNGAIDVAGDGLGLSGGIVSWGDFDNDGDLDLLSVGDDSAYVRQLRVYANNGNKTFGSAINVAGAGLGLDFASLRWGDFDNDGDLDILVSGANAAGNQLRVYRNNGNGTFNSTAIDVESANNGLSEGDVDWGDFDNDGDLDVLVSGLFSGPTFQLRVYRNNGNGSFDANQIEVESINNGLYEGSVDWGDFDNDGDLDIVASGQSPGFNDQLRVYRNNGNGTISNTQIDVESSGNGLERGGVAWGDFDNDGDLDILASGAKGAGNELRVYRNNGNGTINGTEIDLDGAGGGLVGGRVAWGDFDNDGDLDVLSSGSNVAGASQLRVYKNLGNGSFDANQVDVDGLTGGLPEGVAWGDVDNDGDLDIAVNGLDRVGLKQLRVYESFLSLKQPNTAPAAPSNPTFSWAYNVSRSTVTFKWDGNTAYDTGFSSNSVYFNLWVATTSLPASPAAGFEREVIAPRQGSPLLGNYLRAAYQTWPGDGAAKFGVYVASGAGFNSGNLATDTSYYFRVQTIDAGLLASSWSGQNVARTDVAPSAVTNLSALTTGTTYSISLSWTAPGDDQLLGNLNPGTFRIYYSSVAGDVASLTSTAATTATLLRVDVATSGVVPGTTRSSSVTTLASGTTYYLRIFSGDEVPNWSGVSNGATAYTTVSGGPYTTTGSGNWYSTAPNAPWPNGYVPLATDTVTIAAGHVVTATSSVVVASMTVSSTGRFDLNGASTTVTITIANGGKLVNNGEVRVVSGSTNAVTIKGSVGGNAIFEGTDLNYNSGKVYLCYLSYQALLTLHSGETIELCGSSTFTALTFNTGSSFIQGSGNTVYFTSHTVLNAGTFSKDTGGGIVRVSGNSRLDAKGQNIGKVIVGHSPDTITLMSPLVADSILINPHDTLETNGQNWTVTGEFVNNGTLRGDAKVSENPHVILRE